MSKRIPVKDLKFGDFVERLEGIAWRDTDPNDFRCKVYSYAPTPISTRFTNTIVALSTFGTATAKQPARRRL